MFARRHRPFPWPGTEIPAANYDATCMPNLDDSASAPGGGRARGGADRLRSFLASKSISPFVSKELSALIGNPTARMSITQRRRWATATANTGLGFGLDVAAAFPSVPSCSAKRRRAGLARKQTGGITPPAAVVSLRRTLRCCDLSASDVGFPGQDFADTSRIDAVVVSNVITKLTTPFTPTKHPQLRRT